MEKRGWNNPAPVGEDMSKVYPTWEELDSGAKKGFYSKESYDRYINKCRSREEKEENTSQNNLKETCNESSNNMFNGELPVQKQSKSDFWRSLLQR